MENDPNIKPGPQIRLLRKREREQPQKRMQRDSFITATLNKKGKENPIRIE